MGSADLNAAAASPMVQNPRSPESPQNAMLMMVMIAKKKSVPAIHVKTAQYNDYAKNTEFTENDHTSLFNTACGPRLLVLVGKNKADC